MKSNTFSRSRFRSRVMSFCLTGLLAATAVSCYYPPDPLPIDLARARTLAAAAVHAQLGGMSTELAFLQELPLWQRLYSLFTGGIECSGGQVIDPDTALPVDEAETCGFVPGDQVFTIGLDDRAQELLDLIDSHVLTESQVDSTSESDLNIRLKPDVFCGMFDGDPRQACHDFLTMVPVYLNFRSYYEDSMYVTVQVGEWRMFAFEIQTWSDTITVYLDLSSMESAVEAANGLFLADGKPVFDDIAMSGYVTLTLAADWAGGHTFTLTVNAGTEIDLVAGGEQYSLKTAAGSVVLHGDAALESATLDVFLGNFTATFPYQDFIDMMWNLGGDTLAPVDAAGAVNAAGASAVVGAAILGDGTESSVPDVQGSIRFRADGLAATLRTVGKAGLTLENVNLADGIISVNRDFDMLVGVALNPHDGGSFDAFMGMGGNGNPHLATSPMVSVQVDWNFDAIAADLREVPAGMGNETWGIVLEGSAPDLEILQGQGDVWARVNAGTLSFSTNAVPGSGVTVSQGMCLEIGTDDAPVVGEGGAAEPVTAEGDAFAGHPMMSAVRAVECPVTD